MRKETYYLLTTWAFPIGKPARNLAGNLNRYTWDLNVRLNTRKEVNDLKAKRRLSGKDRDCRVEFHLIEMTSKVWSEIS